MVFGAWLRIGLIELIAAVLLLFVEITSVIPSRRTRRSDVAGYKQRADPMNPASEKRPATA